MIDEDVRKFFHSNEWFQLAPIEAKGAATYSVVHDWNNEQRAGSIVI